MDETSFKKLTFFQLEGSKMKGKPQLRWLDVVLQDLKTSKVANSCWKKAQDREGGKAVIREAKAHNGLQCQRRGGEVLQTRKNCLYDEAMGTISKCALTFTH
jgi:hypothetical protein